MKTSFENTAGLGHSSCRSMWSRVRRGVVSPAGWAWHSTRGPQLHWGRVECALEVLGQSSQSGNRNKLW